MAKTSNTTWELLDKDGQQIEGVPIKIDTTLHYHQNARFEISRLANNVGNQIIYLNTVYIHFHHSNKLEGPFLHHWRTKGCLQRSTPCLLYTSPSPRDS